MTSCEKFSHNLTLEVQIVWKISVFQCYWWKKYRNAEKFPKISIKVKNFTTFYEAQIASRLKRITQAPSLPFPPDKSFLRLWNTDFLTEIYKNIQAFAFQVFRESSSWTSRNSAVQIFLLTWTRNVFPGKFVKWVRFLVWLFCWGSIFFTMLSEWKFVKWVKGFFFVKLYL